MKVNDTKEISPVEASTPSRAAEGPTRADKVSLGKAKEVQEAVTEARARAGVDRAAAVEQVVNAVRNGQYQANARQIADRIMQAAELDAKLRAMLSKK